ncbi:pyroglutamyl-peptidase I [Enterococcus sp. 5H]|uniref:pyroglutamyl-peptidase I n=1 Tax=Enterococcus sp. 5H TaxID=1229490 RepID=UPI002302012F|nr:pyroglutamyl-peptidase I [Enterococcus sp. 5H]MDA9470686.1 Pyrrolidone-carboxylate peptidase [Enterococcus sp. 5H]
MKIVVTGFDPFGGEKINPAYEAVKLLPDTINGATIVKVEVPTVFGESGKRVKEAIEQEQPDVVLCVGQAGGRGAVSFERVAINLVEARIPDNKGNQPLGEKVKEDGDTAYFTSLPIKAMLKHVNDHGLPAYISYTAGTFVCNEIMYQLLYMIDKEFPTIKGGFIHVPFEPGQVIGKAVDTPSMPIPTIAKTLELAIEAITLNDEEIELNVGTTH